MFQAQYLHGKVEGYTVYGPWFPKGGDNAEFTIEMIAIDNPNTIQLTVAVLSKNTEDTGNGGAAVASTVITTATGLATISVSTNTLKELVRYKYTIAADNNTPRAWWLFRMLSPVWYDAA